MQDGSFPSGDLDDPGLVARCYEALRREAVSRGLARSAAVVDAVMEALNAMAHVYAAHANLSRAQNC